MAPRPQLLVALLLVVALSAGLTTLGPPAGSAPAGSGVSFSCADGRVVGGAHWLFCWELDEFRGQGLEITDVRYRGVAVLGRAGVPFGLTDYPARDFKDPVKDLLGIGREGGGPRGIGRGAMPIDPDACPRWLSEGSLTSDGKVCVESAGGPVPRVALWSRFDLTNYRFIQGYVMSADGTLEPKLLLGGDLIDEDECERDGGSTCALHVHHAYWRFDVDVAGPGGDSVQEYAYRPVDETNQNDPDAPACSGGRASTSWCTLAEEAVRVRDPEALTKWRVVDFGASNANGNPMSIELLSRSEGPPMGPSSGDAWALLSKGAGREIGHEVPGTRSSDDALRDYADPPEAIAGADVVLWYSERVLHEPRDEEVPSLTYHEMGPILRVRNFVDANRVERTFP